MKLPDWLQGSLMKFSKVSVVELAHVDAPEVVTSRDIEIELAQTIERLGLPIGLLEMSQVFRNAVGGQPT
jgi:hypothetical protein